ncbi:MAG TPA: hypothetical protein VLM83_01760, partial [Anaerolineales bacterium]|nr:hypothetical protein [Anaerolineales bacterium]
MLKTIRTILIGLILFSALLSPGQVRADIAPLQLPGGAALDPGDATTMVRMVAETVTLQVAPPNQEPFIEAQVSAEFTMRNMGDAVEQILVGFPLSCDWCMVDETGYPEEIDDLMVYVNTLQVATRRDELTFQSSSQLLSVSWAVFNVTFPPGEDVFIRVTYTAGGTGEDSNSYRTFLYALVTGAGWYDTIGSVDIIARLPYSANEQNTWFERSGLTGDSPIIIPAISGNELRWHFEDLEPTQDFELTIVHPWQWFSVQVEEENVRLNPQDGEAWGRLGRIYKQMLDDHNSIRMDSVAEEIYARSVEAYEHATTLLPNDPLWHAGYAELLLKHLIFSIGFWETWDTRDEDLLALTRVVDEARRSLEIDPDNELALSIIDQVDFTFPGAVRIMDGTVYYPILTSTAGISYAFAQATSIPTITPRPTATPGVIAPSPTASLVASNAANISPTSGKTEGTAQSPQILAETAVITDPGVQTSNSGFSPLWLVAVAAVLIAGLV